jgi:L-lactate dehydrogenase complex protein LldF
MGVSGVNFASADTGTMVTVTNEGNARLSTTAPRVHVAVMGMERVVPTIGDMQVMLEVLARSATGQRLSVYTNFVTGPAGREIPTAPRSSTS